MRRNTDLGLRGAVLCAVLLGATLPASAATTVSGATWEMSYGNCGAWYRSDTQEGVSIYDPLATSSTLGWNELLSNSAPWAPIVVEFDQGATSFNYVVNESTGDCDWSVLGEWTDGSSYIVHLMSAGPLQITKFETLRLTWALRNSSTGAYLERGIDVLVWYEVVNTGTSTISNFRLLHGFNADPEYDLTGATATINDVENAWTGDSYSDWAGGYSANELTAGIAPCEPADEDIGFTANTSDADASLSDPGVATSDQAVYYRKTQRLLAAGESISFGFIFGAGTSDSDTRSYAVDGARGAMSFDYCACDEDADGWSAYDCGGNDCDDTDADFNPGATEVWYDGIDLDCMGDDDYDADGDGHSSPDHGGDDCDDTDYSTAPDGTDTWYDGIDSDCDDADDYDADGDGHRSDGYGGDDCDDMAAHIYPGAEDLPSDGIDQDCSGEDELLDEDGDGLTDEEEAGLGTDPESPDTDEDGLTDYEEVYEYHTDPLRDDTDEDGISDGDEVDLGTDPTSEDTDGDALSDLDELEIYETDPTNPDTDEDGLNDGEEIDVGTDPLDSDTDGDGLLDGEELDEHNTDPRDPDTDSDGLEDGDEVEVHHTNPRDPDTDDGSVSDGDEVSNGTDPLDPSDDLGDDDDDDDDDSGDHDRGHGNDEDGVDEDNPANDVYKGGCGACDATGGLSMGWLVAAAALVVRRRRR
jgi:Putative metal-binding motif/Bacterial TSP3 repeat